MVQKTARGKKKKKKRQLPKTLGGGGNQKKSPPREKAPADDDIQKNKVDSGRQTYQRREKERIRTKLKKVHVHRKRQ